VWTLCRKKDKYWLVNEHGQIHRMGVVTLEQLPGGHEIDDAIEQKKLPKKVPRPRPVIGADKASNPVAWRDSVVCFEVGDASKGRIDWRDISVYFDVGKLDIIKALQQAIALMEAKISRRYPEGFYYDDSMTTDTLTIKTRRSKANQVFAVAALTDSEGNAIATTHSGWTRGGGYCKESAAIATALDLLGIPGASGTWGKGVATISRLLAALGYALQETDAGVYVAKTTKCLEKKQQ
jgi:hypothetical protein